MRAQIRVLPNSKNIQSRGVREVPKAADFRPNITVGKQGIKPAAFRNGIASIY